MKTLIVVSCGSSKIWKKHPEAGPTWAKDAYQGVYYKLNKEYAEKFGDGWVILSAKYGFIEPDFVIPKEYNVTFNDRKTHTISVEELKKQVDEKTLDEFDEVVVLGGSKYSKLVEMAFESTSVEIKKPLKNFSGMGYQMGAVRRAIDTNTSF